MRNDIFENEKRNTIFAKNSISKFLQKIINIIKSLRFQVSKNINFSFETQEITKT